MSGPKKGARAAGFLLDTCVISALSPGAEAHLPGSFADWLKAQDQRLFLPCIAVAELAQGIAKLHRNKSTARARRLEAWLDQLLENFGERVLPLDARSAREAGRMSDAAQAAGRHPGFADVAIAAIARHHELTLLTRNLKHFLPLGLDAFDPMVELRA